MSAKDVCLNVLYIQKEMETITGKVISCRYQATRRDTVGSLNDPYICHREGRDCGSVKSSRFR